jgi:hypothetical protein
MRKLLTLTRADLRRGYSVSLVAGIVTGLALFGLHAGLGALGWPAAAILAVQVGVGAVCLLGTITRARGGEVWREIRWRLGEAGYHAEDAGAAAWLIRRLDALA